MTATGLRSALSAYIVTPIMTLLLGVALLVFVWGLVGFLQKLSAGGDTSVEKQHMIWGILGFVIMSGAYAIIQVVLRTFNISTFQ